MIILFFVHRHASILKLTVLGQNSQTATHSPTCPLTILLPQYLDICEHVAQERLATDFKAHNTNNLLQKRRKLWFAGL